MARRTSSSEQTRSLVSVELTAGCVRRWQWWGWTVSGAGSDRLHFLLKELNEVICSMLWRPRHFVCVVTTQNLRQRPPELRWVAPFFSNSFRPVPVLLCCELGMFTLEWREEDKTIVVSLDPSISSFQFAACMASTPAFSVEPRWVWPNTT